MMPMMLRQIARDPLRMVHLNRAILGLMATPKERLPRVVTGDIGGAFGSKTTVLREEIALCAAALRLGRSISGSRTATSTSCWAPRPVTNRSLSRLR